MNRVVDNTLPNETIDLGETVLVDSDRNLGPAIPTIKGHTFPL